jgi:adhesin transport system outer membrane protein
MELLVGVAKVAFALSQAPQYYCKFANGMFSVRCGIFLGPFKLPFFAKFCDITEPLLLSSVEGQMVKRIKTTGKLGLPDNKGLVESIKAFAGLALVLSSLTFIFTSAAAADFAKGEGRLQTQTPSGALSSAAAAAAAAAHAANAAANAANAAAAAASAAIDAINSVLPPSQRIPSIAKPSATTDSGKQIAGQPTAGATAPAPQSAPTQAIENPAPAPTESAPPVLAGSEKFVGSEEQSLVGLVGRFEVPVTVDARSEFAKGVGAGPDGEGDRASVISAINLAETISAARGFSRDVLVAAARADQAQAQSGQALASLLPSASYQAKSGRETSSPSVALGADGKALTSDTHSRRDSSLTLRQPLVDLPNFMDWRRRGVIEQSRNESRRASEGDAYLSGVNAYLGLVSSRLLGDLAREFESQINELLAYVEKRASAGAASASDLALVRARSQAAISSRLEQDAAHAAAGTEYVRLTNLAPRVVRLPELADIGASMMPDALDRAVEIAMDANPEIASLSAEVRAADIDKTAAKSRFLPRLDLEYTDNFSLHAGGDTSAAGQRDKRTMLVLNWNFFSGGGDIKYNDERSSRHAELRYRLDDQRRRIVQTLSAQYATIASTRERLSAGYKELRSISAAAEAMSKRMLSGNQSLLDLLDVYDRRYQARARLVNLHTQEMGAVAQVVRLVRGVPGEAASPNALSGDAAPPQAGLSTKTRASPRPDNELVDKSANRDPGAAAAPSATAPDASGKHPSDSNLALPPVIGERPLALTAVQSAPVVPPAPSAAAQPSLPVAEPLQPAADANLPAVPAVTGSGSNTPEPAPITLESLRLESVTNLNALARARYPNDIAARNEYRRLMALANPSIFAGRARVGSASLKAGTVLTVPTDLPPAGESMSSAAAQGAAGGPLLAVESPADSGSPDSGSK